jgi:hypothetical protein
MPKRVGGGLLGHHERLHLNKIHQAPTLWTFINSLLVPLLPTSPLTLISGLLISFVILLAIYHNISAFVNMLLKRFLRDAPPPWALAKRCIFIPRQRHNRKHGRYKLVTAYPPIQLRHLLIFLPLLFTPSTSTRTVSSMENKLRHIKWATSMPAPTFSLEHFDVTIPLDEDPSAIVKILHFLDDPIEPQRLTKQHAPLYFSLVDGATCYTTSTSDPPLIIDTGASVCISPVKSDFKTYHSSNMRIKDLSSSNSVAGEGLLHWNVVDINKKQVTLILPGFHIPTAEVRLLSPQLLLTHSGGYSHQTSSKIQIHLDSREQLDAHYCPHSRLPMLQLFHDNSHQSFWTSTFQFTMRESCAYPTILSDSNANLSAAQKEVLLWHHKLSHASTAWIQLLMRDRKWLSDHRDHHVSLHAGPFLPCRTKGPACDTAGIKCMACLCAKAQRRSPHTGHIVHDPDQLTRLRQHLDGDKTMVLKRGHMSPGDCVSADHYLSPVNGRLYSSYGRESHGYTCGTLFVDHASGKIFNFPQLSTTAADTIRSKHLLERLAFDEGLRIKHYHSDNGIFASAAFKDDCAASSQHISFSGVGAHHQNGIAERNIKTVSQWARANMLHAAFHWTEHANIKLWPQAVDYAVWVFNRLPSVETGLSPNELWSNTRSTSNDLRRTHPFGCPVFVLDPVLQDGNKLPKWNARARRGMFVGFSPHHSSLVPLILNISTGKITPQYHVVFDDKFQTVVSLPPGTTLRDEWLNILAFGNDCFLDIDTPDDIAPGGSALRPLPPEFRDWLSSSLEQLTPTLPQHSIEASPPRTPRIVAEQDTIEVVDEPTSDPSTPCDDDGSSSTEGASAPTASTPPLRRNPKRAVGTWKDGPAKLRTCPMDNDDNDFSFASSLDEVQPVLVARRGLCQTQQLPKRLLKQDLLECHLLQNTISCSRIHYPHHHLSLHDDANVDSVSDPRVIEAYLASKKTSKYDADNPSFDMAMNGPFQGEFHDAMRTELTTLVTDFKCWDLVPRQPGMNVLPSTWAFKIKRYPDGSVKKFKARFCARGDRQLEGVDYFETWAPVVQWSTIRIVLIIALKLGYCSAQCDITAAFIHALLPDTEEIYVHQPRGFHHRPDHVLRLRRSLYGLKQAPRHFFQHLTSRILKQGLTQSRHDPCLFFSSSMIVIVYVDDLLVFAATDALITNFIESMRQEEINLRREGTAEGYLGVDIQLTDGKFNLTQSGLCERVIHALGLNKHSTSCKTPAECSPLPKDTNGEPPSGLINYSSVVGMLLYLSGHTRPDISFAVHQCARYTFAPTRRHELALVRIGRYLLGTADKGLLLDPSGALSLDCYPDADFAGLWNHEHPDDPHCVRSRTGYVILLAGCPVLWTSKMQTEIALSTMEAEYIALSTACRDLFPLMDKLLEITSTLSLPYTLGALMHVRVHEDNVGALTLGKLEPRRMTPRSRHYAVKYHWFREELDPRNVELVKIASVDQLGDIFTKGLGIIAFTRLRKQLMGW